MWSVAILTPEYLVEGTFDPDSEALGDVGVGVHAADDALDEGVRENELEVLDRAGAGLATICSSPGQVTSIWPKNS